MSTSPPFTHLSDFYRHCGYNDEVRQRSVTMQCDVTQLGIGC